MELLSPLNCSLLNDFGHERLKTYRVTTFGVISAIIIVFKIVKMICYQEHPLKNPLKEPLISRLANRRVMLRATLLVILSLSLPWVILFFCVAIFYKGICSLVIRLKDHHFVSFLDSFDVFWSLEDDASKSVINILGIIEADSAEILIEHVKDKLQGIVTNAEIEKIFYRRNEDYGFYYWRRSPYVDLDQYVRLVSVCNHKELSVEDLEEVMSELSYESLPFNDEGLFQILVTSNRINNSDNNEKGDYGIIFRIHHSVGDGVALVQFLCQVLADEKKNEPTLLCMPETYKLRSVMSVTDMLEMLLKLCEIPICFIDGILRDPDISSLHGQKLLGKKVYKWIETQENLFDMIKEIKVAGKSFNFSDILVTALSHGLKRFFLKEEMDSIIPIPDNVAVILPIRFKKIDYNDSVRFENDFTVSILDLPIRGDEFDVRDRFKGLRNSADPLTNYYFLKVCGVLPRDVLQPMFTSSQATMVFSNMPGPHGISIAGGDLKSLVFFIPNNGTTGLGVTALCYGGVLRLAAMADSAVVPSSDKLGLILDGMVEEIGRLHSKYVE
ncbi:uncharacterized protein LOC121739031 [Aricia agestis]|uniref:uncharacterized protein LOC121739031 n=1 Tax=Aricia agestis TaxID=91739 RepID=UPI001C2087CD|nr:uncharacterized protein LOC121739031 [Aricia agestis]